MWLKQLSTVEYTRHSDWEVLELKKPNPRGVVAPDILWFSPGIKTRLSWAWSHVIESRLHNKPNSHLYFSPWSLLIRVKLTPRTFLLQIYPLFSSPSVSLRVQQSFQNFDMGKIPLWVFQFYSNLSLFSSCISIWLLVFFFSLAYISIRKWNVRETFASPLIILVYTLVNKHKHEIDCVKLTVLSALPLFVGYKNFYSNEVQLNHAIDAHWLFTI